MYLYANYLNIIFFKHYCLFPFAFSYSSGILQLWLEKNFLSGSIPEELMSLNLGEF